MRAVTPVRVFANASDEGINFAAHGYSSMMVSAQPSSQASRLHGFLTGSPSAFVYQTRTIDANVNQFVVERRYEPGGGKITSIHLARVDDYDELDITTWKFYFSRSSDGAERTSPTCILLRCLFLVQPG